MSAERSCFGFFVGDETCRGRCSAAKKCKAVLVTHGFDIAGGVLEELLSTLPEGAVFTVNPEILALDRDTPSDEDKKLIREEYQRIYEQLVAGGHVDPSGVPDKVEPGKVAAASL